MSKTLIIGLDGATFDLIIPWIKEGALPNLARLMEQGSYGKLKSTPNKMSPAAWTSFSTGKNPGKHGVYNFHTLDPSTLTSRLINSTHRDAEPLWSYLSRMRRKVGVFNVPATFPADKVNGFMLAGWDAPSIRSKGFAYPAELVDEILEKCNDIPTTSTLVKYKMSNKPELAFKEIRRELASRALIAKYLKESKKWDLFVTVFIATDEAQHHFWHYMDKRHPMFEPTEVNKYGDVVRTIYETCDEIIGDLIKNLDEDTTIIIMSDHGGTVNSQGTLYLPHWLEQLGLANKKSMTDLKNNSPGQLMRNLLGSFKKTVYDQLTKRLSYRYKEYLKKLIGRQHLAFGTASKLKLASYDWSQTRVYVTGTNLRINLKGREIHGIVSPGKEYDEIRDFVIEKLRETRDIETGQKIVKDVFKREEVYHGQHVEEASDLIIAWTEDIVISGMSCTNKSGREIRITKKIPDPNKWSGQHSDYGIFIAKGPHIKKGQEIDNAKIVDITPTVIYLTELAVPDDMDGKVLTNIITESFLRTHPVKYTKPMGSTQHSQSSDYSEEDANKVKEQLENMGYL